MLKDFFVDSYRGLQELSLENLNRINVLVGPNNCGKTSILEAIILSGLFDDTDLFVNALISRYHGFSPEYFESLFSVGREPIICLSSRIAENDQFLHTYLSYVKEQIINKDEAASKSFAFELHFSFDYENKNVNGQNGFIVRFEDHENNYRVVMKKFSGNTQNLNIPCRFISFSRFDTSTRLIEDIDRILDLNLRRELTNILKIFDERIINFEIVGKDRTIKLFKENQNTPLTLYDYGNGMYKAFFIATSALLSKDGILLIDEIETGIHGRALNSFIEKLLKVCAVNNVQIFLTTHSLETIDIILNNCRDQLDDVALYHIRNEKSKTIAKRYGGSKLLALRNEIGFDVR